MGHTGQLGIWNKSAICKDIRNSLDTVKQVIIYAGSQVRLWLFWAALVQFTLLSQCLG